MSGGFFSKERITAGPGFNRWLVPPAALAVHLSIGQVYAFSVFNRPLSETGNWSLASVGWIFSIAIVFLGLAAAFGGRWSEDAGPRATMFLSAACFGGGFLISALGVITTQLWIIFLGYGVLGGIGLGLAYISPVKTLIRWFPDRRGMATGMAIMGFGGGAFIGSPLGTNLMNVFETGSSQGVAPTFLIMGTIYLVSMCIGALAIRVPPEGWQPEGWTPPEQSESRSIVATGNVHVNTALKTPQFWLLWVVLCMNVTAGIGVLGQASVMIQETFGGAITAAAAGGFVGLLSIFNMAGRIFWASLSDYIGRKMTYYIFFGLGIALYASVPLVGSTMGSVILFVAAFGIILSMYGGGFSTIPAYLSDVFGTAHVGAIHGRLLTAWSVAGVAGPVLVNYIRQAQINAGVAEANAYNITMFIMAGLLVAGFICNLLVRPMNPKYQMETQEQEREKTASSGKTAGEPA